MGYSKLTKAELIKILELERAEHDTTKRGLDALAKQNQRMDNTITALKADLFLAERTVVRLMVDETIRQDLEARNG